MKQQTRLLILIAVSALYFVSFFQRVAVPGTIFNELQAAFSLSASGVAALGTIYLYTYGALQPLAGILADRGGAGRTLLGGGLLLSVGSLIFPLAHSVASLYAARLLVGVGAALIFICIVKEVSELFGEREFPFYLSLTMVLGYGGGLFGTLPFERVVRLQGWRYALLDVGVFCTVALLVAACLLHRHRRLESRSSTAGWRTVKAVLRKREALPLVFTASVNFAVYFLLQATLGKKFLQDACALSSAQAASFTFAMMLTGLVCIFGVGALSRHYPRRKPFVVIAAFLTLTALVLLLFSVSFHAPGSCFLACYVLLAISSSASVIFSTSAKELQAPEAAGTAISLLNASAYVAVALMTSLVGVILDVFRPQAVLSGTAVLYPAAAYQTIFSICIVFAACSLFSSLHVPETGRIAVPPAVPALPDG